MGYTSNPIIIEGLFRCSCAFISPFFKVRIYSANNVADCKTHSTILSYSLLIGSHSFLCMYSGTCSFNSPSLKRLYRGMWSKADTLTLNPCIFLSIDNIMHLLYLKYKNVNIKHFYYVKTEKQFFCIFAFEFFWLPDRFAPALGQTGHSMISLSEILLCIIVGKFHSNLVLFTVVVRFTGIYNYTSDKFAIQRLLK